MGEKLACAGPKDSITICNGFIREGLSLGHIDWWHRPP